MLGSIVQVFYAIVLPILILVGAGYVIQKRHGLEMQTLVRLNFNLVVPAIIFYSVLKSDLSQAGLAVGFTVLVMAGVAAVTLAVARLRGIPRGRWRAMLLSSVFYNSGNFSLPLQEMAWRDAGLSQAALGLQAFVMIGQNLLHFTIGAVLAAGGKGSWRSQARAIAQFPPLWAMAAAVVTVACRHNMTPETQAAAATALRPFWDVIDISRQAFMAIALLTMGAQLATVQPGQRDKAVSSSVVIRMFLSPLVGLGVVWMMGLHGLPAQALLISTAAPAAVNSVLLCVQFNNHPEVVSRSVLYSTLISPVTTTLVIWAVQSGRLG